MKCQICKLGIMTDGFSSFTFTSGETVLVLKNVPAKVCNNCGEEYFEEHTAASVLDQAMSPINQSSQFQVRRFIHKNFVDSAELNYSG